jgi:hypothetical protein
MYIAIAELQEAAGKTSDARKLLQEAIKNNAQPVEKVQDVLT